jgi:single-strand DNA-binding protein
MSINRAILIGHLGQDPEIRSTQDGREIASFSVATSESWTDKRTGEKQQKTEWHRVVVFSQGLVGIVKSYAKKGSKLYLEGALATRKWTDKNGIERFTTEIILQNFNSTLQLLNSQKSEGHNINSGHDESGEEDQSTNSDPEDGDDKIPF